MQIESLSQSELGKKTTVPTLYDPNILFAIERKVQRKTLPETNIQLSGEDQWPCYELSWLDQNKKPQVKMAIIHIPCQSPYLVESKSLKLYLNSFNNTTFQDQATVTQHIERDLSAVCKDTVQVMIYDITSYPHSNIDPTYQCLDTLDYQPTAHPGYRSDGGQSTRAVFYTHLFRSYCPVTHQPDWASIVVAYQGHTIDREKLLGYLIHFRNHRAFHEHCIEHIFIELYAAWKPIDLMVKGYFSRRGGIAIHPVRHTIGSKFDLNQLYINR